MGTVPHSQVVRDGNVSLSDDENDKLVVLRMNREFMNSGASITLIVSMNLLASLELSSLLKVTQKWALSTLTLTHTVTEIRSHGSEEGRGGV